MLLEELFKNYVITKTDVIDKNLKVLEEYDKKLKSKKVIYNPTLEQLHEFETFYKQNINNRIQLTTRKISYKDRMRSLLIRILEKNNKAKLLVTEKVNKNTNIEKLTEEEKAQFIKTYIGKKVKENKLETKRGKVFITNVYKVNCNNHKISTTYQNKKYVWHGSSNKYWPKILHQNLKKGKNGLFGNGVYFADVFDKSMQYTDTGRLRSKTNSSKGYVGLFELYIDNCLEGKREIYTIHHGASKIKKEYDIFYAKKGTGLVDNEYCVYKENLYRCVYLVEIKKI